MNALTPEKKIQRSNICAYNNPGVHCWSIPVKLADGFEQVECFFCYDRFIGTPENVAALIEEARTRMATMNVKSNGIEVKEGEG